MRGLLLKPLDLVKRDNYLWNTLTTGIFNSHSSTFLSRKVYNGYALSNMSSQSSFGRICSYFGKCITELSRVGRSKSQPNTVVTWFGVMLCMRKVFDSTVDEYD